MYLSFINIYIIFLMNFSYIIFVMNGWLPATCIADIRLISSRKQRHNRCHNTKMLTLALAQLTIRIILIWPLQIRSDLHERCWNEWKINFQILTIFSFWDAFDLVLKIVPFSNKFEYKIDLNSKTKIYSSFVSANCASFMKIGPFLRGGEGRGSAHR